MNQPDTSTGAGAAAFPGFGEGAPLDLSGLTTAGEAALVARMRDGTFDAWADTAARVGYCSCPVRLTGKSTTIDAATGEVLSEFSSTHTSLGVLYRPCGNRRAEVCPSCSRVYARDTFELVRAGILGGKTVPAEVADNPLLFLTLTAPSFGHVHGHRDGRRCRPRDRTDLCPHRRPTGCMTIHDKTDPANGSPVCPDCYDWNSAVVWQWWAPELWRRTTISLRRGLAASLGVSERELRRVASLQYAKVAEHQARGLIHFHALIRLDGPDGPGSLAPLDGDPLARIVTDAARATSFIVAGVDQDDPDRTLAWGQQLDVRVVRDGHRTDDPDSPLAPEQVAGYLAKYATKDVSSLRQPRSRPSHVVQLSQTCRRLAKRARVHDPQTPYRLLGKWAHTLGFRGHFSTKSRRYSVTLGRLRRARHRFQILAAEARRRGEPLDLRDLETRLLADDEEETTLVLGNWAYQGTGWLHAGEEALALAAAGRAREYAQWRADQYKTAKRSSEKGQGDGW